MIRKAFAFVALLALPLAAVAQSEAQLIERYTTLAGSKENAASLVGGLHDGKQVTLKSGSTTETFTLKQKMGYGSIDNALALAEAVLKKDTATPQELEAVLMGGKVGSTTYEGILKMRYEDKMGWGVIAQKFDLKLGELKRSDKATPERMAKVERAAKPEKPERPDRPERPEKPERPGKGR